MYLAVAGVVSAGASPVVRIPSDEPWMIKRALDCGAHGLLVPMCETREQAERIAHACRYPSLGQDASKLPFRGAGAMFAPANFGLTGREYLARANENITIIVQIETKTAANNVEAIANVEGIDGLFVGPNDLASSMGFFALDHAKHPQVQDVTERILNAGKKAGKFVGHFALDAETGMSFIHRPGLALCI